MRLTQKCMLLLEPRKKNNNKRRRERTDSLRLSDDLGHGLGGFGEDGGGVDPLKAHVGRKVKARHLLFLLLLLPRLLFSITRFLSLGLQQHLPTKTLLLSMDDRQRGILATDAMESRVITEVPLLLESFA